MKWKDKSGLKVEPSSETSPVQESLEELNRLQSEKDKHRIGSTSYSILDSEQREVQREMLNEQGVIPVVDTGSKRTKWKLF